MEISCIGSIHDGTITFSNIRNISSRQYGIANGFVSWTQNSSAKIISSDKKTATVSVNGTLTTKSTFLGSNITYTYDHVIGMTIKAS